jgi:hypothetical protein
MVFTGFVAGRGFGVDETTVPGGLVDGSGFGVAGIDVPAGLVAGSGFGVTVVGIVNVGEPPPCTVTRIAVVLQEKEIVVVPCA